MGYIPLHRKADVLIRYSTTREIDVGVNTKETNMEIVLFFHLHTTDLAAMKRLKFILKEYFLFLYGYFFMKYCFFVFNWLQKASQL